MTSRLFLLIAALLLLEARGRAQPPDSDLSQEAKQHLDRALAAERQQHYAEAIEEFKQAYSIDARPALLYNIGNAYRLDGDCKNAIAAYEAFLRADPPLDQRTKAQENLRRCRALMAPHTSP